MIKTIRNIRGLHRERLSKIDSASRNLREGKLEDAERDLKWIESSSRVLTFMGIGKKCFVVICALLVLLAYTLRLPSARISFKIESENLSLILAENWTSDSPLISDRIFVNNLLEVSASGLNLPDKVYPAENAVEMDLQGKNINLNELVLLAGAKIEFNTQGDVLRLFVKGAPLAGQIYAQNADLVLETQEGRIEKRVYSEIPETISFRSAKTAADPVRFDLSTGNNWQLRGLIFQKIGFLEESPPGSGHFLSAIHSGEVILPQTGASYKLGKGDSLILEGAEIRRMEISKAGSRMEIFFEGIVKKVSAGTRGIEEDITPTVLKWIYHQQRVAFFWIAFFVLLLKSLLDVGGVFMSLGE